MKNFRWLSAFLLATLALFLVASCQKPAQEAAPPPAAAARVAETAPPPPPEADPSNPCNTGPDNNPNAPILCIDDTNLAAITIDPPPATSVHLNAARTAHWFTKSGTGTVGIVYDSELLDPPDMKPGKGHTKAKAGNQAGSVKYSVVVQKGDVTSNVIDPTIIIDTNP